MTSYMALWAYPMVIIFTMVIPRTDSSSDCDSSNDPDHPSGFNQLQFEFSSEPARALLGKAMFAFPKNCFLCIELNVHVLFEPSNRE